MTLPNVPDDSLGHLVEQTRAELEKELERTTTTDRRRYLRVRLEYLKTIATKPAEPGPVKVFVSYNKKRIKVFEAVRNELLIGNFKVKTGFDDRPRERDIIGIILSSLKECRVYVGILTPDMKPKGSRRATAPSPWTIVEEGMAIALGKEYVLMVHERVHEEVWLRIDSSRRHFTFTDKNYEEVARQVRERVEAICDEFAPPSR